LLRREPVAMETQSGRRLRILANVERTLTPAELGELCSLRLALRRELFSRITLEKHRQQKTGVLFSVLCRALNRYRLLNQNPHLGFARLQVPNVDSLSL
jgi:hypothetical protein